MSWRDTLFVKHLMRRRRQVLAAAAVLLGEALVTVALPLPLRFIMNHLLAPAKSHAQTGWLCALFAPRWLLAAAVACLALLYLCSGLLDVGEEIWLSRAVNGIVEGVRGELVDLLLTRRQRFVDGYHKADIVGRISGDAANLEAILSVGLPTVMRAVPTLVMVVVLLTSMNRLFALAMVAVVLVMYLFSSHFSAQVRAHEKVARREVNHFEQNLYQGLQAFPLIKSLALEEITSGLMAANARRITDSLVRSQISESLQGVSLGATKNFMRLMIILAGGAAVMRGDMLLGDLMLFLSYVDSVASPVNDLSKFAVKQAKARIAIDRIEELAAQARAFPEAEGAAPLRDAGPLPLRLRDVSFAHEGGAVALRNFCAYLQPGDLVAVAGPSGVGKTTFLKLLNRLHDPAQGEILLGGRPLTDFRLRDLRSYVTVVPQETFFLSGTIRENLRIASSAPATDEQMWRALERVHARGFVAALPGALDARIGEGGLKLSGGEERRLSVARAFLRPRRGVFVFDEPTSGLDPASAGAVMASIRALAAEGAIVLWSTHRMEEVSSAAHVLFFAPGQNPALGSHAELSASCPAYAALLRTHEAQSPAPAADRRAPDLAS